MAYRGSEEGLVSMDSRPHVIVTMEDIYREVVGLKEKLQLLPEVLKRQEDHESRIRGLERRVYAWAAGIGAAAGAVVSAIMPN